jgi:hypothetical protein
MKKFGDWVNENAEVGGMGVDNKEQLKSFSVFKEPKNGDRMYSVYNGKKFVGIFFSEHNGTKQKVSEKLMGSWYPDHLKDAVGVQQVGYLMFPPISGIVMPFRVHESGTLHVGYEGPIVWDQKEGMFYAPADSD